MENYVRELKNIFANRRLCADRGEELPVGAEEKLWRIFSDAAQSESERDARGTIDEIRKFMADDKVKERKLLEYCLEFSDPTVQSASSSQGMDVSNHAYLKLSELELLRRFVDRHKFDVSFGERVFEIMEQHEMTPPQVYKNALLRRQDFARATDPRSKNVTRKMAWQIILGLHCSLPEADDLLFSAGYIRRNNRFDLTMQYFIVQQNYDIEAIDAVLSEFGIKTFACE